MLWDLHFFQEHLGEGQCSSFCVRSKRANVSVSFLFLPQLFLSGIIEVLASLRGILEKPSLKLLLLLYQEIIKSYGKQMLYKCAYNSLLPAMVGVSLLSITFHKMSKTNHWDKQVFIIKLLRMIP